MSRRFQIALTEGSERKVLLRFALPFILGNLLQQGYNIADSWIVGRWIGPQALAAVGTSFALMVFLNSILIGLCMGAQVKFSRQVGAGDTEGFACSAANALVLLALLTVGLTCVVFLGRDLLLNLLRVDPQITALTSTYLQIVFVGIPFVFLYNYFASLLRAKGNSTDPVIVIVLASLINIALDLILIVHWNSGIAGAAWATVIAQVTAAVLLGFLTRRELTRLRRRHFSWRPRLAGELLRLSILTSVQQSIMNFGILLIQSLVNSFGYQVTAAFAAGVKIDSLAYMPVQDYGNAFSVFVSQNLGAGRFDRLTRGYRAATRTAALFSICVSLGVFIFAPQLIGVFISGNEAEMIRIGVRYLRIEGSFYFGIAWLFLYYGLFRGLGRVGKSIWLTIISLGTRVILAYSLSVYSVEMIWWSIPIGWALADLSGYLMWRHYLQTRARSYLSRP